MKQIILLISSSFTLLFAQLPSHSWNVNMGGYFEDEARSIAVDGAGNTYVAGYFAGTVDFDPGPATLNIACNGGTDIFILKLDPNGNLLWVKDFGSNSSIYEEAAYDLAIDANSNVYVTGYFRGMIDFDPGPGVYNMSSGGGIGYGSKELFVLKLNSDGDFVWATCPEAYDGNSGNSIALDNAANVYVTGTFRGMMDLDPGAGSTMVSPVDEDDTFIIKYDSAGTFLWGKSIGGKGNNRPYDITTYSGEVYVVGNFSDTVDFDPGASTVTAIGNAFEENSFLLKLTGAGDFAWVKTIGDLNGGAQSHAINIDNSGNIFCSGYYYHVVDFDPGAGTFIDTNFNRSLFVQKLDASGNFSWVKLFECFDYNGDENNEAHDVEVDASGNVFVTGTFGDTVDFDPGLATLKRFPVGATDMFIVKLDPSGNYIYSEQLGGNNSEYDPDCIYDISLVSNDIYIAGTFTDVMDCDPGVGTINITSAGWNDILIMKLGQNNNSIQNYTYSSPLRLYPNPSNGLIYFHLSNTDQIQTMDISIMDLTSKIVYQGNGIQTLPNQDPGIDISHFKPGIYMVNVLLGNRTFTSKLIKY